MSFLSGGAIKSFKYISQDDDLDEDDVVNDDNYNDCVDDIDDDDGRAIKSFKYTSWHGPGRLFFIKEMKDSLGESAN